MLPLLFLTAGMLLGCGGVRMRVIEAQEEVIERHPILKPAEEPVTRFRLEGARLTALSRNRCLLAERVRVLRTERREGEVALPANLMLLAVAAGPLIAGTVVLADASNVYPDDRNSRLFNKHGQANVLVTGIVLSVFGGLLAMPPIIQMVRGATAQDTRRRVVIKTGPSIEQDVACEGAKEPPAPHVGVLVGSHEFGYQPTGGVRGRSDVDLLKLLPDSVFQPQAMRKNPTASIFLNGNKATEIALSKLAKERLRRSDHAMWQQVAPACGNKPSEESCAGVRAYLKRYPSGEHRSRAQSLLSAIVPRPTSPPSDPAAVKRARKAARDRCRQVCSSACFSGPKPKLQRKQCEQSCQAEACP